MLTWINKYEAIDLERVESITLIEVLSGKEKEIKPMYETKMYSGEYFLVPTKIIEGRFPKYGCNKPEPTPPPNEVIKTLW